jgi:hypothetical protein
MSKNGKLQVVLKQCGAVLCSISLLVILIGCSRERPVAQGDDASKYVDIRKMHEFLPGRKADMVGKYLGPPDHINSFDPQVAEERWIYKDKFWNPDAKIVYTHVTLVFSDRILKEIQDQ